MATYDLEEQEQLDELKTWWKMHGNRVTALVVAASIAVVGWQGWQWWQARQSAEASLLYTSMQQALGQQDLKRVRLLSGELIDKFSGTAYAGMGALLSGKVMYETGDLKSAQAQFGWAAEHAADAGMRDLARLRQATVLADDKAYDEALKLLASVPASGLQSRYLEVRGDILMAQGKLAEGQAAYDEALKSYESGHKDSDAPAGPYREILKAKRDTGGAA